MPFKPGDPKPPGSGRKKKTEAFYPRLSPRNEDTAKPLPKLARYVTERLEQLGLDPIAGLARIGIKAEEAGEFGVARLCYSDLAQFVYPRRRAVEHTGLDGGPILVSADPFDAITRELTRIADRSRAGSDPPQVQ